jgi:F-type H+-transporting ATPase subunit b
MRPRRSPRFLLAMLVVAFLSGMAVAQQQPAPRKQKPAQPRSAQAERDSAAELGPEKELEETSREAAGEDSTAEFKHSETVRWLARATGLSPLKAYWVFVTLNFVIIAVLLAMIMKSKLPGAFRARSQTIRQSVAEARQASEEARRRLSEIEGRLARLDSEIAAMGAAAEAEAQKEEARILAAAKEDKRRIVEAAEQEIDAATRLARTELRAYASALAVSLAEKRIQVNAATDQQLVRSFIDQLGKNGQ